jgi:putative CocE/NonD family hydrolase
MSVLRTPGAGGRSEQGRLAGSAPVYDVVIERDVGVRMRDGIQLVADVYLPALDGRAVDGRFPTVIERTPYDRGRLDLELTARYFAARGYVVVLQDSRGRFDSDGRFHFFFSEHHEGLDGNDTLAWIAGQPWSDGKVGTTGLSLTGANQQALAITHPENLTTQVILDCGYNYWRRPLRVNGAFNEGITLPYVFWMAMGSPEAAADPSIRQALRGGLADIEQWTRRLPLKRGASPLALVPDYEDWYLEMATTGDYVGLWTNPTATLEDHIDEYPDIPVCFVTSWYGHHAWANFVKLTELRRRNQSPVKLVSGIWLHAFDYMQQSHIGDVEFGNAAAVALDDFRLRWFDQFLKGLDTGVLDTPTARVFHMGGGSGARNLAGRMVHGGRWLSFDEWPPPEADTRTYHLTDDGQLAAESPEDSEPTTYVYDPAHPVPTIGGAFQTPLGGSVTGLLYGGAFDQRGTRSLMTCTDELPLSARPDVLVFRTPVLEHAVDVVGDVEVRLWVSSSAPDTDFTVKLVDEHPPTADYPEGYAMNIVDSIVRMRYRNGRTTAELIEPGRLYEITIAAMPTANRFAAGHRIRLDISSSSFPQFDVNPNTGGPLGQSRGHVVAHNSVYHDRERPSRIVLPVLPEVSVAHESGVIR